MKHTLALFCSLAVLVPGVAECAAVSFQTSLPYTASFANSSGQITITSGVSFIPYRGSNSSGFVNYSIFSFNPRAVEFILPTGGQSYVASLEDGTEIKADLAAGYQWQGGTSWRIWNRADSLAQPEGYFTSEEGVIGFRISDGSGGFNYGYFKGEVAPDGSTFTITEGAYETTVNTPITTVVPEPSAALLGGLATLSLLRRRR